MFLFITTLEVDVENSNFISKCDVFPLCLLHAVSHYIQESGQRNMNDHFFIIINSLVHQYLPEPRDSTLEGKQY